jgi:hypothetical protein
MASFFRMTTVAVRAWRGALVAGFLVLSVAGCGGSKGQECDVCTTDEDCTANGLFCVPFSDGSKHCGSGLGSTQCRKPLI